MFVEFINSHGSFADFAQQQDHAADGRSQVMRDNGKNFVFDGIQFLQFLLFLPDRFFKLPHCVFTEIQGQENEHQSETIIDDLQYPVRSERVAGQEGSQRKVNSDDTRRDPAKRQYDVPSVMQEKEDKEQIEKKIDF